MGNGELADESTEPMDPSQTCLKSLLPLENTVQNPVPEVVAVNVMGPPTPAADRENVDFLSSDSKASSTTMVKLCSESTDLKNEDDASSGCDDQVSSPRTPKDCVFDPFAPDRSPFAPLIKNHLNDYGVPVTRRLQFASFTSLMEDDEETASWKELCAILNEKLLEAVVLKQKESVLPQLSSHKSDTDGCKTPFVPNINGVPQTCPGAPIKPAGKPRNIDLGLCRKFEF